MLDATAPRPVVPDQALRLGYAGLLPFVLGAALDWLVKAQVHPYVTLALSAYAGVVLSFLGAVHWGLAMRQPAAAPVSFVWAVMPSLVAWVALVMPASAGLVLHGVMLLLCYVVDRKLYPVQGVAHWLTMRFRLTVVATLSCFVAAAGT